MEAGNNNNRRPRIDFLNIAIIVLIAWFPLFATWGDRTHGQDLRVAEVEAKIEQQAMIVTSIRADQKDINGRLGRIEGMLEVIRDYLMEAKDDTLSN